MSFKSVAQFAFIISVLGGGYALSMKDDLKADFKQMKVAEEQKNSGTNDVQVEQIISEINAENANLSPEERAENSRRVITELEARGVSIPMGNGMSLGQMINTGIMVNEQYGGEPNPEIEAKKKEFYASLENQPKSENFNKLLNELGAAPGQ